MGKSYIGARYLIPSEINGRRTPIQFPSLTTKIKGSRKDFTDCRTKDRYAALRYTEDDDAKIVILEPIFLQAYPERDIMSATSVLSVMLR